VDTDPVATLNDLVAVRSQLAEGLKAYLQSFIDLRAWDESSPAFVFLPEGLSQTTAAALELYQAPDVVNLKDLDGEKNRRRSDLDARGEFGRGPDAPRASPWSSEKEAPGYLVVLGRPGEGKTLLTRLTCRDVAKDSLDRLDSRGRSLSDIPVPIWLTLDELLAAGSDDGSSRLESAVRQAVRRVIKGAWKPFAGASTVDRIVEHVTSRLAHPSTWLFIDALDETGNAEDADRRAGLACLRDLPAGMHVVMTCRKLEYHSRAHRDHAPLTLPDTLPDGTLREYDLEPLNRPKQEAFVSRWFDRTPEKRPDVLDLIAGHPQLQDMAGNGLMLTLICATREHHEFDRSTRRVELYDLIVRDMVGLVRRAPRRVSPEEVSWRLSALKEVAWSFFEEQPSSNSMEPNAWRRRLVAACAPFEIKPAPLHEDLKKEGLLVSHEKEGLRFLHRSFLEYLAGAHLASLGVDKLLAVMRRRLAEPEWEPWRGALTMAFGHLARIPARPEQPAAERQQAARRVVENVIADPPGAAGGAVAFIGEAVFDAGGESVPAETLQQLRDALLRVMRDNTALPKVRAAAGAALGRLGDHRFHDESLWCLPKLQSDPGPDGQLPPEPLLGFVEIPEGEFWMGSD